jgi:serine/threonine protein kinase
MVYLVQNKDNGKHYAMKVLKKNQIIDEKDRLNTLVEKAILQKIRSPFLV